MSEVSHVAEIRFTGLTPERAAYVSTALELFVMSHCADYELQFHPVGSFAEWRRIDAGEKPSSKQLWFLNKSIGELETLTRVAVGNGSESLEVVRANTLWPLARAAVVEPDLTRARVRDLIDVVVEALEDLKFEMTGRVPASE